MFIPDGAGALINFAATTKARNMFYGRYYGNDLGMTSLLPWDPELRRAYNLSLPVFGMAHTPGENAFIAVTERGAAYGEIQAHPAGVITQFNFLHNAFVYNESYFQATNRSGAGVTVLQPQTNEFDVVMHYRFLTGADADYVGMARSYQAYLLEKGLLSDRLDESPQMPIRLEFLGAEKERILFWYRSIPVTTIAQARAMLDQLDLPNTDVVYFGWQRRGANAMYPASLRIDGSLGSVGELRDWADEVAAGGGRFYLYVDPQAALRDVGGYSSRHDLALSITNQNLTGYNRYKVNYYLNIEALSDRLGSLSADMADELNGGLALDGIGSFLYSDFREGELLNREQVIPLYQELVARHGLPTALYLPNDYLFPAMSAYYDAPLTDSGYLYVNEVVPFLQIALAGYVPLFGPALNFASNQRADLLRQADFGLYPAYILTQEPTARFLTTSSSWIFSSSFEQWGQEVRDTYAWLSALLAPVKGEQVVARQSLASGVVAVTYSNGQQIVVNYNTAPYTDGSLFVEAQDAIIREVEP
jgi:hypothetical protein